MELVNRKKISCEKNCLKAELVEVLKKIAPLPLYEIDEIAKKHGHEILRPPHIIQNFNPLNCVGGLLKTI
jgi:hypothetical protein